MDFNNNTRWWRNEIIYQVYPRSFQDSNNDGIGDLNGIISRLDYIKSLGVTMIWLSPVYQSPMVDMGYDISDYQAIDPQFGTMDDFDNLLIESKKRNIKIIMDLVINHTSDQHKWFQNALTSPNSPYRKYYIFKKTSNGKVPNNWRSIFGGSTWTEVPNEPGTFYFHTFAPQQPDLNWENPAMRKEIYKMINWWLKKGIAGFRADAITHLKKDLDWASIPADSSDGLASVIKKGQNRPGLDVFLNELKKETFDKYHALTVGEAYGVPEKDLAKFIGPDGYFSMIFDFSYMNIDVKNTDEWFRGRNDWTVKQLKTTIFNAQKKITQVNGWSANVLENHDQPRVLSKLIKNPQEQTPVAAKALAVMYYFLPGTPFIYQGQELGMKNFERKKISDFNDVSSLNNYKMAIKEGFSEEAALKIINAKSRDNARTPMQWTNETFAGFSKVQPWLEMGNDRKNINVAFEDADKASVLNCYRSLSHIRNIQKVSNILSNGTLHEYTAPENIIAYYRELGNERLTIIVNLSSKNTELIVPNEKIIFNTINTLETKENTAVLKPYQAIISSNIEYD